MATKTIDVRGDQIEVHADIGPVKVLGATLRVEDKAGASPSDPNDLPYDEWEKLFDEMLALAPMNEHPADVSREAMYLSDEEMGNRQA